MYMSFIYEKYIILLHFVVGFEGDYARFSYAYWVALKCNYIYSELNC